MINEVFTGLLGAAVFVLLRWAFKTLPDERWQILASVPKCKNGIETCWQGENLTFYGFFSSFAYTFAVIIFIILAGSLRTPLPASIFMIGLMLAVCMPASKMIAKIVEKKSYTFTIGGASFIGAICAPWIIWITNTACLEWFHTEIPVIPTLSAILIAYTFGEGLGRLACISFGCCYGKSLDQCGPLVQRLFSKHHFIFTGKTKKISYAHQLDRQKTVPVQGLTSVMFCVSALAATYCFLNGFYVSALLGTLFITQCWRCFSEFLRADHRGGGKVSAYQIMGILSIFYMVPVVLFFQTSYANLPNIAAGMKALWNPAVLLSLQGFGIFVFLRTGRSKVTCSTMTFSVVHDRV